MNLILSILIVSVLTIFSVVIYIRYKQRRKEYELEKQKIKFEYQNAKLNAQLEIQEMTFKIISQEIHDNIGQILSLAKLNLNTVNWEVLTEAKEKTNAAKDLIVRSINDLRDLSKSLHPDWVSERGLLQAIEFEAKQLEKLSIKTIIQANSVYLSIENTKQLTIFRIIQEILQNIIKHSGATQVLINIDQTKEILIISVADNGIGFNTSAKGAGMGINNMLQRVTQLGGSLEFLTLEPSGTNVLLTAPVNHAYGQNSFS
ncbi:MAG: ATP-binding protein [Chitinophagaceae bacterium]